MLYAILVSVVPIAPLEYRRRSAQMAAWITFVTLCLISIELHPSSLRLVFEAEMYIETPGRQLPATGAKAFTSAYDVAVTFAMTMAPLLAMICPF